MAELSLDYDIDDRLKSWLVNQAGMYIAAPIMLNQYHCFNNSQNKNNLVNFLFSFGQDNFESFLNNQEIDSQDKFYALITKYIIVSTLPEEFKSIKDQEMDLFYNYMEDIIKKYAEYIRTVKGESIKANFILTNSLATIIDNVFLNRNETDYSKDIEFVTSIFNSIPNLNKDRLINFQGQPLFNKTIQNFLKNINKNSNAFVFSQKSIENDSRLIYKFLTTDDNTNNMYESIDSSKSFSGNFICNFPGAVSVNGNVAYGETRCQPNVLSEILSSLCYGKIPEGNKVEVVQLLCSMLNSLCDHIKSLKDTDNLEELQKINYLLNCPIRDPENKDF